MADVRTLSRKTCAFIEIMLAEETHDLLNKRNTNQYDIWTVVGVH